MCVYGGVCACVYACVRVSWAGEYVASQARLNKHFWSPVARFHSSEQLSNVPADKRMTRQPGAARACRLSATCQARPRSLLWPGMPTGSTGQSGHACWSAKQHHTKGPAFMLTLKSSGQTSAQLALFPTGLLSPPQLCRQGDVRV